MEQELHGPRLDEVQFKLLEVGEIENLEVMFTMEEIKEAIWNCEGERCPGPGGYNFSFIKKIWGIIENDIVSLVKDFHKGGKLPKAMTSFFLALIPKYVIPKT